MRLIFAQEKAASNPVRKPAIKKTISFSFFSHIKMINQFPGKITRESAIVRAKAKTQKIIHSASLDRAFKKVIFYAPLNTKSMTQNHLTG